MMAQPEYGPLVAKSLEGYVVTVDMTHIPYRLPLSSVPPKFRNHPRDYISEPCSNDVDRLDKPRSESCATSTAGCGVSQANGANSTNDVMIRRILTTPLSSLDEQSDNGAEVIEICRWYIYGEADAKARTEFEAAWREFEEVVREEMGEGLCGMRVGWMMEHEGLFVGFIGWRGAGEYLKWVRKREGVNSGGGGEGGVGVGDGAKRVRKVVQRLKSLVDRVEWWNTCVLGRT